MALSRNNIRNNIRSLRLDSAVVLVLVVILISLITGSCRYFGDRLPSETNFSQYRGFAELSSSDDVNHCKADEQYLLERHKPIFMLPRDHAGLIDFYADYIAHGVLYDGTETQISTAVSRDILNNYKNDPLALFIHNQPEPQPKIIPAVYGRVDYAEIDSTAQQQHCWTFLSYYSVFRHSGLLAGIPWYQERALSLVADVDDWHQLDNYTTATLVLDETETPVALHLQQHNGGRTYLIGESVTLHDNITPIIDVAIRSNELYPHQPGPTHHRAVRFPDPDSMRYLLGFGAKPFFAATDITDGVVSAPYCLEFLPYDDAFYTWQGYLGMLRRLPGRDGPPGADYNTIPSLKPWQRRLFVDYWREGEQDDYRRFEQALDQHEDNFFAAAQSFAAAQRDIFQRNWQQIKEHSGKRGEAPAFAHLPDLDKEKDITCHD